MKKMILIILLTLLSTATPALADGNGSFSAKDLEGLSTQQKLYLIQSAEETVIRKGTVEQIQKNASDERFINVAVEVILGVKNGPPDPQNGWDMIKGSSINGQRKLELLQLLKNIYPEIVP